MEQKENARCALTSVIENELDILKRHIDILNILQEQQPIGIIKISESTGYPQHMVRYSLRILEQEGLIEPSSRGAVTTSNVTKILHDLQNALDHIAQVAKELNRTVK
jgi:predicted transcriptional regulator